MAPKGKKSIREDFVKAKQEYHVQSEKAYKDYMQNGHESIKETLKQIQAHIDRYVTLLRANREEFRTASEPNPPDMEHIASVINSRRRDALELARDKPSKTSRASLKSVASNFGPCDSIVTFSNCRPNII